MGEASLEWLDLCWDGVGGDGPRMEHGTPPFLCTACTLMVCCNLSEPAQLKAQIGKGLRAVKLACRIIFGSIMYIIMFHWGKVIKQIIGVGED